VSSATPYLEGIRVLDFSQYLAGPACTRLLAEMGADVIKVEIPPYGDPTRATTPRRNRRSAYYVQQNRGKRSLCIDVLRPEGVEVVKELVPHVDVVVENYSPGVMARRGLGYDDLRAINPRIIMASVSGFGQTGPLASKTAFDFIAQAYTGIMHMTGEPDGPPTFVGAGIADTSTGVHAFAAIGYALFRRDRTGEGAHIDVAMVDAMYHMQEMGVSSASMTGGEWKAMRTGRHYQPVAPAGTFKGPQGWIVVFCVQNQIPSLWAAMGRPELAGDERFATNPQRVDHRDELTELIETWMAGFDTDREVLDVLELHRVPCGPVLSPEALADAHPHFLERGTVREVTDKLAGTMLIPGFPIRFSDAPPEPDLVTPDLGEHNREILAELLGYDDATVDALEADGVLASKDR
jgi:crotonobetainyl-CoA:carnitine CoA-transferase CaiB-like acyl-CoA transferase